MKKKGMKDPSSDAVFLPSTEILIPRKVCIRYKRPLIHEMVQIRSPQDANRFIRLVYPHVQLTYREYFWVLCLNASNYVLGVSVIGMGHDRAVCASVKEIVQLAFLSHASSIITMHNHPGGSLTPSKEDLHQTKSTLQSLNLLGVSLLDAIILTEESYLSMADEGMLE